MNRYDSYKESGVAWLGEVPSHWEMMSLKFICDVRDGTHDTPQYVYDNNSYPLITSKDISKGYIDFENVRFISKEDYLKISQRSNVNKGDLIMPMIGTVGGCVLVDTEQKFAIKNIALFKEGNFNAKWLKYFLDSELSKIQFELKKSGGVQDFVGLSTLRNLKILKLPLAEQTAIANYLDQQLGEIDALIAKQQQLLEKLAEQRTATITTAVTKGLNPTAPMKNSGVDWLGEVPEHWEVKRLKFLGDIVLGLTYSPENITDEHNGALVLRSSNIQNGKLVFNDNIFVNSDIPKKTITTEQDILICSRNGSRSLIGKCALIEGKGLNQAFGAFMTVYRTPYRKFVYYTLNSEIFKSQLGLFLTSTINQLTTQVLGNFKIAFPPLAEQTAIVDYLDQITAEIDRLCDTVNQAINRLKEYRTALITQAVTGKVKVV